MTSTGATVSGGTRSIAWPRFLASRAYRSARSSPWGRAVKGGPCSTNCPTSPSRLTPIPLDRRYFATLAIPLLRGREFSEGDGKTTRPVAIINERMARMFWPNQDPLTKGIPVGPPGSPVAEIVGIVKDVRYRNLRDDGEPMIYFAALQSRSSDPLTLHVRATADPTALAASIRRQLQALDARLPVFGTRTLEEQMNASFAPTRQAAVLTGGFGILALLLSAIGVYRSQRSRSAVRHTTSASGWRLVPSLVDIAGVMSRRALALVVAGLSLGLVSAFGFQPDRRSAALRRHAERQRNFRRHVGAAGRRHADCHLCPRKSRDTARRGRRDSIRIASRSTSSGGIGCRESSRPV